MHDSADRAAVVDAGSKALVLGLEVAAVDAGGGQCGFLQRHGQELAALAGAAGSAFAGGLVVTGTAAGPAGQVTGRREDGHVDADLSDHDFGRALGNSGDRGGQPDADLSCRAQLGLDRVAEAGDLLVEEVQVSQDRADDQRVMGLEAALQRFA